MALSAAAQRLLNPREVYEAYEEISTKNPALERPDRNLVTAAFCLSAGIYIAETLAQHLFASSVFDAYDVYFWVGLHETAHKADLRLAKRVTLLPSPELKGFWIMRLMQEQQLGAFMHVFEEQMTDRSGAMPVPVSVGPVTICKDGHCTSWSETQEVQMAILAKGSCSCCGAPKTDSTMKCSCGCAYCSKKCQKQHWHVHKQMEH